MTTITLLKKVETLEQLEALKIGNIDYDLSYRGGYLGFRSSAVAEHFKCDDYLLPNKFGAYCNYLGGGIRGSVVPSNFGKLPKRKTELLKALGEACVRVYINLENENNMNNEYDEYSGEPNWEAMGTNRARLKGIVSGF
jgi:hypothetical protein